MADKKKRPKPRDKRVGTSLSQQEYDEFYDKAKKLNRKPAGILRSFIRMFNSDEYPVPPEEDDENVPARYRRKKKK